MYNKYTLLFVVLSCFVYTEAQLWKNYSVPFTAVTPNTSNGIPNQLFTNSNSSVEIAQRISLDSISSECTINSLVLFTQSKYVGDVPDSILVSVYRSSNDSPGPLIYQELILPTAYYSCSWISPKCIFTTCALGSGNIVYTNSTNSTAFPIGYNDMWVSALPLGNRFQNGPSKQKIFYRLVYSVDQSTNIYIYNGTFYYRDLTGLVSTSLSNWTDYKTSLGVLNMNKKLGIVYGTYNVKCRDESITIEPVSTLAPSVQNPTTLFPTQPPPITQQSNSPTAATTNPPTTQPPETMPTGLPTSSPTEEPPILVTLSPLENIPQGNLAVEIKEVLLQKQKTNEFPREESSYTDSHRIILLNPNATEETPTKHNNNSINLMTKTQLFMGNVISTYVVIGIFALAIIVVVLAALASRSPRPYRMNEPTTDYKQVYEAVNKESSLYPPTVTVYPSDSPADIDLEKSKHRVKRNRDRSSDPLVPKEIRKEKLRDKLRRDEDYDE